MNHNRVYRIYRLEGLAVRKRRRKRVAGWRGETSALPARANQRWSMNFMPDTTKRRGSLRTLTVVDDHPRECLPIEVDTSLPAGRVVGVLERLRGIRGLPEEILMDNRPGSGCVGVSAWGEPAAHRTGQAHAGSLRGEL